MSNIKKHQCPSCGGNLSIDNDKQLYHCTFCGSTYDYEYFREEQMHEMGATYLLRKEFQAAADAYKFILSKDPHDFLALRGLMLAAARLKNMDELVRRNKNKDFSYNRQFVSDAVEGASEEDKEYFEDLGKLYSDLKRLSDCTGEIETLGKARRKTEEAIHNNEKTRNEYYFKDRYSIEYAPHSVFMIVGLANIIFILLTFICAVILCTKGDGHLAFVVALFCVLANIAIAVLNFKLVYPRVKKINEIDAANGELYSESEKTAGKIKELKEESDRLATELNVSVSEFVKKDKLIMRDLEQAGS
ncbi:hypothetical protein [Butyrivibrio sp. AE2032]|uniref:hypothetical protein n=1 Tax=Butyrivibrio sp. AE2032 TaxID=1458463 RepID=UPI000551B8F5|nr:hypothetical protein [Butyrivibrio sp. AE2032]